MGVKNFSRLTMRSVASSGLSTRIERNLGILKITPSLPIRFDQYKAGPFDVRQTKQAMNTIGTHKSNKITIAKKKIKKPFH